MQTAKQLRRPIKLEIWKRKCLQIQNNKPSLPYILVNTWRWLWNSSSVLGRFPLVRTGRPDPSVCKENATIWRNTCMRIPRILLEEYLSSSKCGCVIELILPNARSGLVRSVKWKAALISHFCPLIRPLLSSIATPVKILRGYFTDDILLSS